MITDFQNSKIKELKFSFILVPEVSCYNPGDFPANIYNYLNKNIRVKGTVDVNSSNPIYKECHVRFTMVALKPLSEKH